MLARFRLCAEKNIIGHDVGDRTHRSVYYSLCLDALTDSDTFMRILTV